MRRSLIPSLFIALAAFGAGCASQAPATNTNTYQAPTEPTAPQPEVPTEEVTPAATSTELTPTESTSTTMTNPILAFPGVLPDKEVANKIVRMKTTKGEIVFELRPDQGPNAASNFVYLTKQKFYDGLTFHRVIDDFMDQGGDPLGNGTGGPGYQFADDPVQLPSDNPMVDIRKMSGYDQMFYKAGTVAMANAGPNTNGSQFFIMRVDYPLSPNYSVFGRVISGQDVVNKIQIGDKMLEVTVEDKK